MKIFLVIFDYTAPIMVMAKDFIDVYNMYSQAIGFILIKEREIYDNN